MLIKMRINTYLLDLEYYLNLNLNMSTLIYMYPNFNFLDVQKYNLYLSREKQTTDWIKLQPL